MGPSFEVTATDILEEDLPVIKDKNLHAAASDSIGQLNYLFVSYFAAEMLILEIKQRDTST